MPRSVGLPRRWKSRNGSATVAVTIAALVIVGTAGAVVAICRRDPGEPCSERGLKARAIAETALSAKISQMVAGNFSDFGTSAHGLPLAGGFAWVGVENFDVRRELFRLTSQASFEDETQVVEVVLRPVVDRAAPCAIFAGNSSNDAGYVLVFRGEGASADAIEGDVYSGRSISVLGDARVDGTLRAKRSVAGAEGDYPVTRHGPDFASLLRGRRPSERTRTMHVESLFEHATLVQDPSGVRAWQVAPGNPAHVFRRNPSDRAALTDATPGDDYFLEVSAPDAAGTAWIDVPEAEGEPGARGASATFVLDGDLWISNQSLRALRFGRPNGEPTNLSVVVRGNIHVGASLLDPEDRTNAIALVALRHPGREASGDIVVGGEGGNPVESIDAFLFAERDIRRGADRTQALPLAVRGALVAGNHVDLDREGPHARLSVRGDARLANGELALAGIPVPADRVEAFSVLSWRALGTP